MLRPLWKCALYRGMSWEILLVIHPDRVNTCQSPSGGANIEPVRSLAVVAILVRVQPWHQRGMARRALRHARSGSAADLIALADHVGLVVPEPIRAMHRGGTWGRAVATAASALAQVSLRGPMAPVSQELLARCDDQTRGAVALLHWSIQLYHQAGPRASTRTTGHLMRLYQEVARLGEASDLPDWAVDAVASVALLAPPEELGEPATDLVRECDEPPGHRASSLPHLRALAPPPLLMTRGREIAA